MSEIRTWKMVRAGTGLEGNFRLFDHRGNEIENVISIAKQEGDVFGLPRVSIELSVEIEIEEKCDTQRDRSG